MEGDIPTFDEYLCHFEYQLSIKLFTKGKNILAVLHKTFTIEKLVIPLDGKINGL